MKKISTTKILMFFLFINCTLIEIFTGWVTIANLELARDFGIPIDFTPLVTLVGAVVSEVLGLAVYAAKSVKENTSGGIIYETAMKEQEIGHETVG
jgi:hypothetical protein